MAEIFSPWQKNGSLEAPLTFYKTLCHLTSGVFTKMKQALWIAVTVKEVYADPDALSDPKDSCIISINGMIGSSWTVKFLILPCRLTEVSSLTLQSQTRAKLQSVGYLDLIVTNAW